MIEMFRPYSINSPKIRLGALEDGGYVCSKLCLEESVALFNYGVGADIRYEVDYRDKYDKQVYLFDHTINQVTGWDLGKNLNFFNEGLGFEENCKDFIEHYDEINPGGDVLLKMDIEGGEYEYFENTNIKEISERTTGILLEVHWLSSSPHHERFKTIFDELSKYFVLNHIHGNNWAVTFEYEGVQFPDVIELSLVNKKYVGDVELDATSYPQEGLDYPNNPNLKDIDLSFIRI
jgi:hypothetical protein